MSIATTLQSIRTNLAAAWTALTNKGATIPANKNIENLATAITSIPAGSNKLPSVVDGNGVEITASDLGSITSIRNYAFYYYSGLTSITIPNSVTSIGGSAFYNCSGLTSVTIPDSVTSIKGNAFYGCSRLTSITIPNSVTSIGGSAFYNCSGLTSVTIPDSVTSIKGNAFYGCSRLTSITIHATTVPTLLSSNAFSSSYCPIYVPYNNVSAYRTTTNWSSLASRIQGFAPSGTFSQGDTLPTTSTEGLSLTWYSDVARTQQVTTVSDPTAEYYCTAV